MHKVFQDILAELKALEAAIVSVVPEKPALGQAVGHWGVASVTRAGLIRWISSIAEKISASNPEDPEGDLDELTDLVSALQWTRANSIPQLPSHNAQSALPALTLTLSGVERTLLPFVESDKKLALDNGKALRRAATQIRGMESKLRDLAPKTASVQTMVERIERAYEAADQLPADLETLNEARQRIDTMSSEAEKDRGQILAAKEAVEVVQSSLKDIENEASAILKQCESVYSSATSVGLAAAFSERSRKLDFSMWFWVVGLMGALVVGGAVGTGRLTALSGLLTQPGASSALITLNIVLSVLSIGAPVWFAWLATKQVGQRFRLSEDYAFKASISRAYEGYRREAARIDPDLEAQLLQSALSRLDEQPLRLVESASYGSPWHELLSSDLLKEAVRIVPGFKDKVVAMAGSSIEGLKIPKVKPTPAASASKPAESELEKP
jgi:hypothetical protein